MTNEINKLRVTTLAPGVSVYRHVPAPPRFPYSLHYKKGNKKRKEVIEGITSLLKDAKFLNSYICQTKPVKSMSNSYCLGDEVYAS